MSEVFFDNWTYLKVELNGLERLLLLAVARQRKDLKEVERVAQTKADRATSHWWKGMVSLEGVAYDLPPERRSSPNSDKGNLQQQVQARIQASQRNGIWLGLPMVCDRLQLSQFEKNVLLLGLAPEVHRRYGQLYGFLQTGKDCFELPKVDLALRLFCRTDQEWREARSRFTDSSPLVRSGLLNLWASEPLPLLQRSIQLRDNVVDFLLGERATGEKLEQLICGAEKQGSKREELALSVQADETFERLVLPEALLERLQHLKDRLLFAEQVEQWGFQEAGTVTLLVGESGTGKTMAVNAIALTLNETATTIDLELLTFSEQEKLLQAEFSTVLEIQSAEKWLGQSFETAKVAQFLEQRRKLKALTFLSVRKQIGIRAELRSRLNHTLIFPKPTVEQRSQLWKQSFPAQTPLDPAIDWQELGRKFSLTGGQIREKARSAAIFAASENAKFINLQHILKAIEL